MTICEPFADVLRSSREEFNEQFAHARRQRPSLQGAAFSAFLADCADPVVNAVAAARPDAVRETVVAAYEAGLELVGQGLAGPGARLPIINEGWRRLLPAAAELIAAAPGRVIGSICNALHQLAATPDARPGQWLDEMRLLAPRVGADVESFLGAGQIAAWRAGLAHFREGALAVADTLPEALALQAVGAAENDAWPTLRQGFRADPWFVPGVAATHEPRVAGRAGAFRGFGGLFTRPPLVAGDGRQWFVRDEDRCWLLTADAFGATFHRASKEEFDQAAQQPPMPPSLRVSANRTTLIRDRKNLTLPLSGPITSSGMAGATLALTTAHSHAVYFITL